MFCVADDCSNRVSSMVSSSGTSMFACRCNGCERVNQSAIREDSHRVTPTTLRTHALLSSTTHCCCVKVCYSDTFKALVNVGARRDTQHSQQTHCKSIESHKTIEHVNRWGRFCMTNTRAFTLVPIWRAGGA